MNETKTVPQISVEQAIYSRTGAEAPTLLANSSGFLAEWGEEVRRVLTAFGARPPGVACPSAVFARPLGKQHVLVVRVADLPGGNGGGDAPLGFHVLVLAREAYRYFLGEPFLLAVPTRRYTTTTAPAMEHQREKQRLWGR